MANRWFTRVASSRPRTEYRYIILCMLNGHYHHRIPKRDVASIRVGKTGTLHLVVVCNYICKMPNVVDLLFEHCDVIPKIMCLRVKVCIYPPADGALIWSFVWIHILCVYIFGKGHPVRSTRKHSNLLAPGMRQRRSIPYNAT